MLDPWGIACGWVFRQTAVRSQLVSGENGILTVLTNIRDPDLRTTKRLATSTGSKTVTAIQCHNIGHFLSF